jgi:diketogulonate reductase-like aldo/keto reductase
MQDGFRVPALGQGTWKMGEIATHADNEARTVRTGIELGISLIDTAKMYGSAGAERLVGQVIVGQRDQEFLVSKINR